MFKANNTQSGYIDLTNHNTSLGYTSLNTGTGTYGVAIGEGAGYGNTGNYFVAIGRNSAYGNTGTQNITSVGFNSLINNTGTDITAIGTSAGSGNTGIYNTMIGISAGTNNTGNYSTIIGHNSGLSNSKDSSIVLGYGAVASLKRQLALPDYLQSIRMAGISSGASTDSLVTWDNTTKNFRKINPTSIVTTPTWQSTVNRLNTNSSTLVFDTAMTNSVGSPATKTFMEFKPLVQTDGTPSFYMNFGAEKYSGISQSDQIWNMGWNINPGGGQQTAGQPGIAYQLEQRYIPIAGDTNTEAHLFYITKAGVQKRLYSYTIKEYANSYDFYHTVSKMSLISPSDPSHQYFEVEPHSFTFANTDGGGYSLAGSSGGVTLSNTPSATQGSNLGFVNFTGADIPTINSYSSGATNSLTLSDNSSNILTQLTATSSTVGLTTYTDNTIEINPDNITAASFHKNYTQVHIPLGVGTVPSAGNQAEILSADSLVGLRINNTHGSGNNFGIQAVSSGGGTIGVGGYFSAFGATNNAAIRVDLPNAGANNYSILSNSSAKSLFAGSVGIGGTDPDSVLHVVGGLKFVTGRQGAGKVMTSDASGGADWQTPATTSPAGNYGNVQLTRNGVFATPGSDSLSFSSSTLTAKGYINGTLGLLLNGTNINTGGTLSNVAYLDQANIFTANQTISKSAPVQALKTTSNGTSKIQFLDNTGTQYSAWESSYSGGETRFSNIGGGYYFTWWPNGAELMRQSSNGRLQIGKSGDAVASAMLEVVSTTSGFLPPRMTATQGSAISSPAEGLLIYVTDTNATFTSKGWWGYSGAAWEKLNN
jgi:hypothetical protein